MHGSTSQLGKVLGLLLLVTGAGTASAESYPIVDTGQTECYDSRRAIAAPQPGEAFFGQDAQYRGHAPTYRDNRDGTITDLVTGLMWQKDPGSKRTYAEAVQGAASCRLGGHRDWRLPTIKELYSLIHFSGTDPDPRATSVREQRPFIDTDFFVFRYGDPRSGERIIDAQYVSATEYVSTTMQGDRTVFGVNFADGRIKGYPMRRPGPGGSKQFFVAYVRGNPEYGVNRFRDEGDGTITDEATGLMWMQIDSGHLRAGRGGDGLLNWGEALAWAEQLDYAGHTDWRLPNVKELQSIVDYTRAPDATDSPAIDPIFKTTIINREDGHKDYPFYWSGTTHAGLHRGDAAAYVAFGESPGWMRDRQGRRQLLDVHGAGSQRSDPKAGDPLRFFFGRGPQGDVIRIYNVARAVRGGIGTKRTMD